MPSSGLGTGCCWVLWMPLATYETVCRPQTPKLTRVNVTGICEITHLLAILNLLFDSPTLNSHVLTGNSVQDRS